MERMTVGFFGYPLFFLGVRQWFETSSPELSQQFELVVDVSKSVDILVLCWPSEYSMQEWSDFQTNFENLSRPTYLVCISNLFDFGASDRAAAFGMIRGTYPNAILPMKGKSETLFEALLKIAIQNQKQLQDKLKPAVKLEDLHLSRRYSMLTPKQQQVLQAIVWNDEGADKIALAKIAGVSPAMFGVVERRIHAALGTQTYEGLVVVAWAGWLEGLFDVSS